MQRSSLAVLVSILFWATVAYAQQQGLSWKEYVFGEDGFAITLPGDPGPHPDAALPEMTVYTVSVAPGSRFSLRVSHQNRDCSATLAQLRDGGLKGKAGVDPASVKEVSFGGYPGVEYQYRIGSDRISSDRFYCVNGRFYAFSTSWPSAHSRPRALDRIVNSFRLVNATASNLAPVSLGDKKPDTGSVSGHVYRNEFFRFTYTLPEDFKPGAVGPEFVGFIDGRNSFLLLGAGSNHAPQSSGELPSEVHVTAWSEPGLWGSGWRQKTGGDYLTKLRTMTPNFEPMGPIKKRTIAGITFYEADAKTKTGIPGLPRRFQKAVVRTTEIGYILQFVFLASSAEELERLDHSIESIHFESQ